MSNLKSALIAFICIFCFSSSLAQLDLKPIHKDIYKLIRNKELNKAKNKIDSLEQLKLYQQESLEKAQLYVLTSRYYRQKKLYDSAIAYQTRAWDIAKDIHYDQYFYPYLRPLSYYHWESGNYSKALTYAHEVLRNIEKIDTSKHSPIYNILGLIYLELGDYKLSEKYFQNAIKLSKENQSEHYLGILYANTGRLYLLRGKLNKALEYYQKGSSLELKYKDYKAAGRSFADIGKVYTKQEKYQEAKKALDKGVTYAKKVNDKIGLCRLYLAYGDLMLKQKKYDNAEQYFSRAVYQAKNKNTQKELMQGYHGLYETYQETGQYKKSSKYLNEYFQIYKDLYNIRKIIEIENLQHKLNLEEEKTLNQQAQLKKQRTINKLLYIIIALSLVIVVVLIILLIRSRKNRKNLTRKNEEIQQQKTDLEHLNQELKKAKERAENSEALKDQFLRNISHEIRTPLNGIIGFSSIIAQPDINNSERDRYQKIVEQNATMLLSTIEDIIDIAKIRTQQITIFKEKFDVNELLKELQKLLLFEKNYLNKDNVEIIINKGVNGQQIIQADEEKIRKILMVLSNNAIKFTENGHIKLGYSVSNSNIQFFIEDTGIGIPKENQKMIFESFRQVDSSMERNYEGVGIGLTIAKAFVEILDGKIWFDSEENLGTTFYFTVPLIS